MRSWDAAYKLTWNDQQLIKHWAFPALKLNAAYKLTWNDQQLIKHWAFPALKFNVSSHQL
jgi:hypothetical protein